MEKPIGKGGVSDHPNYELDEEKHQQAKAGKKEGKHLGGKFSKSNAAPKKEF